MEVEATNTGQQPRGTGKVKLDVGGFKFTTSRATLCRFPGTFLEVMFSGRHDYPDMEDGSYFIDRDGRHFHHVLNFLRSGYVVSLPDGDAAREELKAEGDFYGLEGLVAAIRQPQVDVASHLSPDMANIREEEDKLRRAFSNFQAGAFEKHHGLLSIFDKNPSFSLANPDLVPPLKYQEPTVKKTDFLCMNLRDNGDALEKGRNFATCESLDQFKSAFNRQHDNILNRLEGVLRGGNIIIAGGSVLRALSSGRKARTKSWWEEESDVDLFIHGVDPHGANSIARLVYDALAIDTERWGVMRSAGVINFHQQVDNCIVQKVQIVLRIYDSPTEVLFGFDVDCCCCAFDGKDVWLTKRCISALRTGMNVVNPIHATPSRATYELRLAKYAKRGYSVLVPGLDQGRVDFIRILPAELSSLKGLARLLKVNQEIASSAQTLLPTNDRLFPTSYASSITEAHLVPALQKESLSCREPAELITSGHGWYDELGADVIVPPVMYTWRDNRRVANGRGLCGVLWCDYQCDFPLSSEEIRNEAWDEILYFENAPGTLPRYLSDAWNTSKRSREYLNAEMDTFNLNSFYYSEAYKQ